MQISGSEHALQRVESRMLQLVGAAQGEASQIASAHLGAGGGRVRARLALASSQALGLTPEAAVAIAAACELLHNASLVHDDLQDRDALRRGRLAVWSEHGDAAAICVGDLLLSAAYASLVESGPCVAALLLRVHDRVGAVIRGQAADLRLRGQSAVSLARYEEVAAGKSGPLLSLPIELALLVAGEQAHLAAAVSAGELFAVGYQMTDDLDDVERDALNEELNVVAVLAAIGTAEPLEHARQLALARFRQARAAALALPRGAGQLLAHYATQRAEALQAQRLPA